MLMDSRLDDLEEKLKAESQEYSNALEKVYHQEESFYNMDLPKEKRVQVDRHVTATFRVWRERLDFVGFSRQKQIIYTLFIRLEDRIGIIKKVVIIQLVKK